MNARKRPSRCGNTGRPTNNHKRGCASKCPHRHYITGGSGVQVEYAQYELEKHSGPLVIHHFDEAKRRKAIADRLGI